MNGNRRKHEIEEGECIRCLKSGNALFAPCRKAVAAPRRQVYGTSAKPKWTSWRAFFKECGRQKVLMYVGGTEGLKQFVTVEELYGHFAARLHAEAGK